MPAETTIADEAQRLLHGPGLQEFVKVVGAVATLEALPQVIHRLEVEDNSTAHRLQEARTLPADEQAEVIWSLRAAREPGRYLTHSDKELGRLDQEVIALFAVQEPAAAELVSENASEYGRLRAAYLQLYPDDTQCESPLWSVVERCLDEKSIQLRRDLEDYLGPQYADFAKEAESIIRHKEADPRLIFQTPAADLREIAELNIELQNTILTAPLAPSEALVSLRFLMKHECEKYAYHLLAPLARLQGEERREDYLASYMEAVTSLDGTDYGSSRIRTFLSRFEDPHSALATARHAGTGAELADSLEHLSLSLGIDYDDPPRAVTVKDLAFISDAESKLRWCPYPLERAMYIGKLQKLKAYNGYSYVERLLKVVEAQDYLPDGDGPFESTQRVSSKPEFERLLGEDDLITPEAQEKLWLFECKMNMCEDIGSDAEIEVKLLRSGIKPEATSLDDYESFQEFFKTLRIPKSAASEMFEAWTSISARSMAAYASGQNPSPEVYKNLTDEEIHLGAVEKAAMIYKQAFALQRYVEKYGTNETLRLYDTFGIVNFNRGTAEEFHDQLLRWKGSVVKDLWTDPETGRHEIRKRLVGETPQWINYAATTTHNFAFEKQLSDMRRLYGPNGFYFETKTALEIAQRTVQVGDRERHAGRDPASEDYKGVRKVIVTGHGTPELMELSHGNYIAIDDYEQAFEGRKKLQHTGNLDIRNNSYRRHLGRNFHLILHACLTAGITHSYDFNLASIVAATHQAETLGAPVEITGIVLDTHGRERFTVGASHSAADSIEPTVYYP